MYFPGEDNGVLYILVYIKLHICNDMDSVHYVCYVLNYNTGTWWNCDDEKITKYSGYPNNVYDNFSMDNDKKGENCMMDGSDRILSMLYIKNTFLHPEPTLFVQVNQYLKRWNILRREYLILKLSKKKYK